MYEHCVPYMSKAKCRRRVFVSLNSHASCLFIDVGSPNKEVCGTGCVESVLSGQILPSKWTHMGPCVKMHAVTCCQIRSCEVARCVLSLVQ
jgi:hypothetical protein